MVLGPLLLTIAGLVRWTSPGPTLFRQRRVGRDGREFDLLEFRTMHEEPRLEEFELKDGCAPGGVEGQDRRTPLGRFLRAPRSTNSPSCSTSSGANEHRRAAARAPAIRRSGSRAEVDRYDDRHRVKSGITGWAQVNGLRGQTSIADRVEWDNHYIQNWSLGST